jgi:hypothetical protein
VLTRGPSHRMPPAPSPPPSRRPLGPLAIAAAAALALALAFGAGRWTGSPPPAATAPAAAPSAADRPAPPDPPAPSAAPVARAGPRSGDPAAPADGVAPAQADAPPAQRTPVAPDVLERLRLEVSASLEARRREDLARCWPKAGLPRGQASATVTYDLTFDPAGREVARGLSDDRRAPAGELGRCLSRSPGAPLTIPPQGTYLSLRVPVTYP